MSLTPRSGPRRSFIATVLLAQLGLAGAARANTYQVNSTADAVDVAPGDGSCASASGSCTLRGAIQEANAHPGADTIVLPAGEYDLTIPGQGEDAAATGDLDITDDLTITGAGAAITIVDGKQLDRVFHVDPAGKKISAVISGITIRNGKTTLIPFVLADGGAVLLGVPNTLGGPVPSGSLTLTDCIVRDSVSGASGGGLRNGSGTMTLIRTLVTGNVAGRQAGGIRNGNLGKLLLLQSTVADNTAYQDGGGVWSGEGDFSTATSLTVIDSTISGNQAGGGGGGIAAYRGIVFARNCTLSGNVAGGPGSYGGGIGFLESQGTVASCTITGNRSSTPNAGGGGGGIAGSPEVTLTNTLVAGNTTAGIAWDCSGPMTSGGHNLIGNAVGCVLQGNTQGNVTGVDASLGPLANNGGPTLTHALLAGSPAIDTGDPAQPGSGGTACPASDQRGFFRPQGAACDIGAVERINDFAVSGVLPSSGGSGGSVLVLVSGASFASGATVKLSRAGEADIPASRLTVSSEAVLTALFDLDGAATGAWDVTVTQADGRSATLRGAFAVEAMQPPDLWAEILGPAVGRPGGTGVFVVLFGNRGNVDALGVPVGIVALAGLNPVVQTVVLSPPSHPGQAAIDWSVAHLDVTPSNGAINIPLLLADVPAQSTGALFLTLTIPASAHSGDGFNVEVGLGTPYFDPSGRLDPTVRDGFVAGAELIAANLLGTTIGPDRTTELTQTVTDQLQGVVDFGRAASVDGSRGLALFSVAQLAADQAITEALRINHLLAPPPSLLARVGPSLQAGGGGQVPPAPCVLNLPKGGICPVGCTCAAPDPKGPPQLPSDCKNLQDVLDGKCKLTPDMCEAMPGFKVSSDGSQCIPSNCTKSQPTFFNPDPSCRSYPIRAVVSRDPNDKSGPTGEGTSHYISPSTPLVYDIEFENDPSATAPAQVVEIEDALDPSLVDLDSVSLLSVQLGATVVGLEPGVIPYGARVDLRRSKNLIVGFDASLDRAGGVLRWNLASLDPATLVAISDPLGGFLPPNNPSPSGEGSVSFSVMPRAGLASGTQICNQASIVFDTNAALSTRSWCNTLDASKPVSHVDALPAQQSATTFTVSWSGTDEGAGIADYTVYVSEDGGAPTQWMTQTSATSGAFTGQTGHSYGFFSVARDLVGNVQDMPAAPDTITRVGALTGPTNPVPGKSGCGVIGDGTGLLGLLPLAAWWVRIRSPKRRRAAGI
jgi:CSLREA domain-containing protein